MKISNKVFYLLLIVLASITSCQKEKNYELALYTSKNITNAFIKDAKCAIDLETGALYSIKNGIPISDKIDIAYGYALTSDNNGNPFRGRSFKNIFTAACQCNDSGDFSYDSYNLTTGFPAYSTKNQTKIWLAGISETDFNDIQKWRSKASLEKYFPSSPPQFPFTATFSAMDDSLNSPYIFFETVSGKRGVIRIRKYTANIALNYNEESNPITIDVIIER